MFFLGIMKFLINKKIPVECASNPSQAKEAHHLVSKYHCIPCTAALVYCTFEIYFGEGVGRNPKELITFTLLLYTSCHLQNAKDVRVGGADEVV